MFFVLWKHSQISNPMKMYEDVSCSANTYLLEQMLMVRYPRIKIPNIVSQRALNTEGASHLKHIDGINQQILILWLISNFIILSIVC